MLDFRQDRWDYGQMLIPPQGYRLDRAIAATYSLDLNTLLSIPVALFYSQTLEGKLTGERFQVLEAIRRTAEVVTVYCQETQLHVPDRYNKIFAFMEDMIVQVRPADAFTSFHPKVWVIRYVREDEADQARYRVLVLTRNLTYDRSWDLAANLEGPTGAAKRDVNSPLVDFLAHLNAIRPIEKFLQFTRGLARAKLAPPGDFDRIAFHPIGIARHRVSPITSITGLDALCMSPFLDEGTVKDLRKATEGALWLFGRKREMAKLPAKVVGACRAYCISDLVVEGESRSGADEELDEPLEQDLHAKLFVFQEADKCRWYVGSANATKAGHARNTEFIVELIGTDRRVNLKSAIADLLGSDDCQGVFEEFTADMAGKGDAEAKRRAAVRRFEYQLVQVPKQGTLTRAENATNYDLTLTIDLTGLTAPKGIALAVKPLNCVEFTEVKCGKVASPVFRNISETDISQFIAYRITGDGETLRSFLVRYKLAGMPDSRVDSIFRSIVSNRDKFFEYLQFLLAEEVSKGDLTYDHPGKKPLSHGEGVDFLWDAELPIFERLLVAASRDPIKLRAVDGVIERLKSTCGREEPLVPPEFLDFWEVFRPLISAADRGRDANGK